MWLPGWAAAQILPPDESLTDQPATERPDTGQLVTPLITPETVGAASPSDVVVDSGRLVPGRRRLLTRTRAADDTSKLGFIDRVLSPVYPNPERAAAFSFVLPGAGQVFNRRYAYIKVPVIYAGFGALIYSGEVNRKLRNRFQAALVANLKDQPHEFSGTRFDRPDVLRTRRDQYDKNFQLSYIGVGILHLVQMLDAYTTAHLLEFDIDDDLSLAPTLSVPPGESAGLGYVSGVPRPQLSVRYRLGR